MGLLMYFKLLRCYGRFFIPARLSGAVFAIFIQKLEMSVLTELVALGYDLGNSEVRSM